MRKALKGTSSFGKSTQRAAGWCKARAEIHCEYIPELCTERHTGWLNIAGSINKLQRIGTRYSAGVLADSAIFTI